MTDMPDMPDMPDMTDRWPTGRLWRRARGCVPSAGRVREWHSDGSRWRRGGPCQSARWTRTCRTAQYTTSRTQCTAATAERLEGATCRRTLMVRFLSSEFYRCGFEKANNRIIDIALAADWIVKYDRLLYSFYVAVSFSRTFRDVMVSGAWEPDSHHCFLLLLQKKQAPIILFLGWSDERWGAKQVERDTVTPSCIHHPVFSVFHYQILTQSKVSLNVSFSPSYGIPFKACN